MPEEYQIQRKLMIGYRRRRSGDARGERIVPEKYARLIQDMYRGFQTKVCRAAGESGSFNVDVELQQTITFANNIQICAGK